MTTTSTYVSDRGDEYEVSVMEISHLVNVISHHQDQIRALQALSPHFKIRERIDMLQEVISILANELVLHDVSIEQYLPDLEHHHD